MNLKMSLLLMTVISVNGLSGTANARGKNTNLSPH